MADKVMFLAIILSFFSQLLAMLCNLIYHQNLLLNKKDYQKYPLLSLALTSENDKS